MDGDRRILAIETSGRRGSVAALCGGVDGGRPIHQIALGGDQRTAQALAPAIQRLLRESDWSPSSVELVAVAVGPGSFTGLRIGVTTAKAFAYAVGAEVIGINTLAALAYQAPQANAPLWTVLDAQRQELFAAKFVRNDAQQLRVAQPTSIIPQNDWLAGLTPGDAVTGTALTRMAERIPKGVQIVSSDVWQPMAQAVGHVAWQEYRAGERGDFWQLLPQYYRASAAEEKKPL
jgi:tRNA threonylcarbamoyladenosine biosynthesis protein TsaB